MKLTVVGPTHPFRGGISHYTSLLVRTLRSRHEVQFLSYSRQYPAWLYPGNNDRDPSSDLIVCEAPDRVFDALNPWAWRAMVQPIVEHQSELVILPWSVFYWAPFYFLFLQALKRLSPAAVVLLCHNVLEHEPSRLKSSISRRTLRLGDRFIVHSSWDKANLVRWLGNDHSSQIFVNPHPLYQHLGERLLSKAEARASLGIQSERVMLFFGFIREYKGLRYLLESMPQILSHFPVHLVVAGEAWEGRRGYLALIRKLALERHVTLALQYIPNEEVRRYFAAADIVAVPYVSATQSGIVQLAFGFGKPVIVGNVGGLTEVIEHLKTGYLVPPRDSEAIAKAVVDFYEHQREPDMIQNVEHCRSRFSWDAMADTIDLMAASIQVGPLQVSTECRS